jgi:uncharacterized caspase-like protein
LLTPFAIAPVMDAVVHARARTRPTMTRILLLLGLACLWVSSPCAAAERRVALVVGAAKYEHAAQLAHSLDDARDMAASLKRLGFDVDLVLDPDRAHLEAAVRRLGQKSRGADAALFFYSGHALESQGVNWVLPVSADVQEDRDLRFEALDLSAVLGQVEGLARVSLIFLDACREDPFKQRLGTSRDLGRNGLATVNANVSGTYVAFATAPGVVAADGNGPHSPFTGSLLKYLETPGLELRQMMSKVRGDVEDATDNRQIPWDSSSLKGDFYFNPANAEKASKTTVEAINGPNPQVDIDAIFWASVDQKKPSDLNAYLARFPQGMFSALARNRLAELKGVPIAAALLPNPKLLEALSIAQGTATQKTREDFAAQYEASKEHRAIAGYLSANQVVRVSDRLSAMEAEESSLEACEVLTGAPCVLVALDTSVPFTRESPARSMPRAQYAGTFDPERIPSVQQTVRQEPSVTGYLAATGPKAAAYYPFGKVYVVAGAANQHDAEARALSLCSEDTGRTGRPGPCFLYASNNDVVLPRRSQTPITSATQLVQQEPLGQSAPAAAAPPDPRLLEALLTALPSVPPKYREDLAAAYQASTEHRALAVYLSNGVSQRVQGRPSGQEAEDSALEACEILTGAPCVLIAVDRDIRYSGGSTPRAMARVHYAGTFDPERIPTLVQGVRQRPDVAGYLAAPSPKAAAYSSIGRFFVVTGSASQRDAEESVLSVCDEDAKRSGSNILCFLYASGNAVVLQRRSRTPMTAAGAVAQSETIKPSTAAFHDALVAVLEKAAPALAAANRDTLVKTFEESPIHKALAVHQKDGGTYRFVQWLSAEGAEQATLEGCQAYFGEPCALLAVDSEMRVAADGAPVARDMPRVRYAGAFNIDQIPAITPTLRDSANVKGYAAAPGPKAIAFHPWGQLHTVAGAKSQNEAETNALATCNAEPTRHGQGGPCYLYASADQVVLPRRLRVAMTPAAGTTPVNPAPVAKGEADDVLINQLAERLKSKMAAQDDSYRSVAQGYIASQAPGHRALAAGWSSSGFKSVDVVTNESAVVAAGVLALERCQIFVGAPCSIMASDREIQPMPADGKWPVVDAARVGYRGDFQLGMIPAVAIADRTQPEAAAYAFAPSPKAVAISSNGKLAFVTAAKSQSDAEAQALTKCQFGVGAGSCFLYAVGMNVILPQRLKQPRPLGNSLASVLAYAFVSGPADAASNFGGLKPHKSIVLFPELRRTSVFFNYDTGDVAKRLALETCDLKFNTACIPIAVDDNLETKDPSAAPRVRMPRVTYQGPYRPEMVPLFSPAPKVATDYVKMRAPKAMAIGPQGSKIAAETGATLQEAQAKALSKCTDPDSPYPCFIYAVNDTVILPQRRTEPIP